MDNGDNGDKLKELVWCNHVRVRAWRPIGHAKPLFALSGKSYLIIEDGRAKLICGDCLVKASQCEIPS